MGNWPRCAPTGTGTAWQFDNPGLENTVARAHNGGVTILGSRVLPRSAALTLTLLWLGAGSAVAGEPDAGRKLYKWVDSQGQPHYGDHVPDEYANQEQHIFNRQGIEVDRVEAQKTPEQAAADAQRAQAAQDSRNRDRNLLSTYASVEEIERLRDQRVGLLSDQIKVAAQFLDILHGRLDKLRSDAAHFRPYSDNPTAPRMPDAIAEDLARVGSDIRTQEDNLRQKRADQAQLQTQFDADIARYRELRGIR